MDTSKYVMKRIKRLPESEWKTYLCSHYLTFEHRVLYKTHIKNVRIIREKRGNDYCAERDFTFEYKGEQYIYREKVPSEYALLPEYEIEKIDG